MTYLQYHLVFIVPVLLLLLFLTVRRRGPLAGSINPHDRWVWLTFGGLTLTAFLYTTPWDNYLVFRRIWSYPPERVLGRMGYVPYEEYAFFILQTLISGLFLLWLMRRESHAASASSPRVRWGGAALLLGLAFVGALCLRQEKTLYLGLILAWAMPVLAGQWAFGGDLILGRPKLFWTAVLVPTLYLWLTDAYALSQGIWHISERFTLGLHLGPLPFEEMLFFLVTNLLVVTGLTLFAHPGSRLRIARVPGEVQLWLMLSALYLLFKIPVPLWPAGFALLGTLSTVGLFLAALAYCAHKFGFARAVTLAALGSGAGWLTEWVGSHVGWPFGVYSYAGAPGITLLGVPLIVPLGWFAMPLITTLLSGGRAWLAGLLLVGWDIGLEPLMTAQHFWQWRDPHPLWSGAPPLNFAGWWLVGSALSWAFMRLVPALAMPPQARHFGLIYYIEWLFLPAGLLLLGQGPAAAVTFAAMGTGLWLSRTLNKRS